jgi:hypothetical protein
MTWFLRTLYFVLSLVYAMGCFNALMQARTRPIYVLLIPLGAVPLWMLHHLMRRQMRKEHLALTGEGRFEREKNVRDGRS